MDDPYQILGVARDATQDQIRKAYKKLAKSHHPDLNPGDKAAEARFKEISGAYGILGDEEKRGRFDRGEIDASGQERAAEGRRYYRDFADAGAEGAHYSTRGFEDFEDVSGIFADLFRQHRAGQGGQGTGGTRIRMPGRDALYSLEVDFLDAARGATRRITLPEGETLDVRIPPGTADGQTIRLRGKGGEGLGGGPRGDALVSVAVRPHPRFRREGDDILIDLPISLDEAVLGAKVRVPTIGGEVSVTVPEGASSGQVLRLRGRGVKRRGREGHGDQRVTLRIVSPRKIDEDLAAFMREWRKTHGYDPREGT